MTKPERIEQAWGKYFKVYSSHIDKHTGWCYKYILVQGIKLEMEWDGNYGRPKSLSGIENNNNWVKIESMDSFPKQTIFCVTCIYLKDTCYQVGFSRHRTPDELLRMWQSAELTHYKIIDTKPPFY
ncbi:MAG: hypothetical protein ACOVRK_12005 [Chryseobacterium taeanense]